jgi:hypothetical protein
MASKNTRQSPRARRRGAARTGARAGARLGQWQGVVAILPSGYGAPAGSSTGAGRGAPWRSSWLSEEARNERRYSASQGSFSPYAQDGYDGTEEHPTISAGTTQPFGTQASLGWCTPRTAAGLGRRSFVRLRGSSRTESRCGPGGSVGFAAGGGARQAKATAREHATPIPMGALAPGSVR